MFKITAAAAALTAIASTAAFAGYVINPGLYNTTTEYTSITNDGGYCAAAGLTAGGFTTGVTSVFGVKKTASGWTPQPGAASDTTIAVNTLNCNYGAFPSALLSTNVTPYSATIVCTASYVNALGGPAQFQITTASGTGTATINQVINKTAAVVGGSSGNTANSFHITGTNLALQLNEGTFAVPKWATICNVSIDTLFIRTGT